MNEKSVRRDDVIVWYHVDKRFLYLFFILLLEEKEKTKIYNTRMPHYKYERKEKIKNFLQWICVIQCLLSISRLIFSTRFLYVLVNCHISWHS